jgi:hypothetical protein
MGATSADPTYVGKVHGANGGDDLVVESGGSVNVLAGGALKLAGVDAAPALASLAGLAGKLATGTVVLGGANPTTVATGLATVLGGVVTSQLAVAPGLDPTEFTCHPSATPGSLDIYAWKPTDSTHPALIASTNNAVTVAWLAFGS